LLGQIDLSKEIMINRKFENLISGFKGGRDTTASITLTSYSPNKLEYQFRGSTNSLAVFSEIYYPKGWNAYIDGQITPHFQADYVLRGMFIPAGDHKIEFRFEPQSFLTGSTIASLSSVVLLLLLIGIFAREFMKGRKWTVISNK